MSLSVVQTVKADLLAHPRPDVPVNLAGPCGAFAITGRVCWALRSDGWGLVASAGNGCAQFGQNYRTDTIMKRDGTCFDILIKSESDNGNTSDPTKFNIPAWGPTGNQDPANWRSPFSMDGATPVDPPVDPPASNDEVIVWLEGFEQRQVAQFQHIEALIKMGEDANQRRYQEMRDLLNEGYRALSEQIAALEMSGRVPAFGGLVTLKQPRP